MNIDRTGGYFNASLTLIVEPKRRVINDSRASITSPMSCRESEKCTFLLRDEVLHDDVGHAVSVRVAVFVEAVHCTEDELVAGDGPVLAAQHLDKRERCSRTSH